MGRRCCMRWKLFASISDLRATTATDAAADAAAAAAAAHRMQRIPHRTRQSSAFLAINRRPPCLCESRPTVSFRLPFRPSRRPPHQCPHGFPVRQPPSHSCRSSKSLRQFGGFRWLVYSNNLKTGKLPQAALSGWAQIPLRRLCAAGQRNSASNAIARKLRSVLFCRKKTENCMKSAMVLLNKELHISEKLTSLVAWWADDSVIRALDLWLRGR